MGMGEEALAPSPLGLIRLRLLQLCQIFGWVFFERGKAAVATEANLDSFVSNDEWLAH